MAGHPLLAQRAFDEEHLGGAGFLSENLSAAKGSVPWCLQRRQNLCGFRIFGEFGLFHVSGVSFGSEAVTPVVCM